MIPYRVALRAMLHSEVVGDCQLCLYSVGSHGYCQIGWSENGITRHALAHRAVWELHHGPIPADMTVDHVCHNRRCVNLSHLRLLTNLDNARDNGWASRSHCPRGHEYSADNTHIRPDGARVCKACWKFKRAARTAALHTLGLTTRGTKPTQKAEAS